MKNPHFTYVCLILLAFTNLQALEIKWESTAPVAFWHVDLKSGADASAAFIHNNTVYWYSPNGTLQATINLSSELGWQSYEGDPEIVTQNHLIMTGGETDTRNVVFSLSEENLTHEIFTGNAPISSHVDRPSSSFFPIVNGTTITMYDLSGMLNPKSNSGISLVPNNSVVIPSSYQGNVEVMLETSNDLIEWSQALPGTYNPATSPRFFRVRAVSSD